MLYRGWFTTALYRRAVVPLAAISLLVGEVGCAPESAVVLQGDSGGVDVRFSGGIDNANAAAKLHCARFERVPRYLYTDAEHAYYACDRPEPARPADLRG